MAVGRFGLIHFSLSRLCGVGGLHVKDHSQQCTMSNIQSSR